MPSPPFPAVIVHSTAHVRLVRESAARLGMCPLLLTAPGAAAYAGVAYLKEMATLAPELDAVIDCGSEAGLAMAAIRVGWRDLHVAGDEVVLTKIGDMLDQVGGRLRRDLPPALDLGAADDPGVALERYLAA